MQECLRLRSACKFNTAPDEVPHNLALLAFFFDIPSPLTDHSTDENLNSWFGSPRIKINPARASSLA